MITHSHPFKAIFDFLFSVLVVVCSFPIWIVIAIAIKLDSKGPVFFVQPRVGKNGKVFQLYKFRTMFHEAASGAGIGAVPLAQGDARITKIGNFLRKTSLDEIPQFINVIKGDMSLIGPRPVLPEQAETFSSFQKQRLQVKPGLTGLVAVAGGYDLTWPQRIRFDVWYVKHLTFGLDFFIFYRTILILLRGRSIYNRRGISEDIIKTNNQ